jgi:hypothetical protein
MEPRRTCCDSASAQIQPHQRAGTKSSATRRQRAGDDMLQRQAWWTSGGTLCRRVQAMCQPVVQTKPASARAHNSAVECHLHTVEVVGSNPAVPTKFPERNQCICCWLSRTVHLIRQIIRHIALPSRMNQRPLTTVTLVGTRLVCQFPNVARLLFCAMQAFG